MKKMFAVSLVLFAALYGASLCCAELRGAKGFYYNGMLHEWSYVGDTIAVSGGPVTDSGVPQFQYWNTWNASLSGKAGACIFNGTMYFFFTTPDHKIQYVDSKPELSHGKGSIKTIAAGLNPYQPPSGAAASVLNDTIYLFTGYGVYASGDAVNWSLLVKGPLDLYEVYDSAAIYPEEGTPKIMVVYNEYDAYNGATRFVSSLFDAETTTFSDPVEVPLPYGSTFPSLVCGNLVTGTSRHDSFLVPSVRFYGLSDLYPYQPDPYNPFPPYIYLATSVDAQFDINQNRWTSASSITPSSNADLWLLGAYPYFKTLDSKGTMHLKHLIHYITGQNEEIWQQFDSDYLVPQHNDPAYGWEGVPTNSANATGDDDLSKALRSFWTPVGIVLGPPPFALNGVQDASYPVVLSSVEYGTSTSSSITTTQTSSKTISIGVGSQIKGGFGKANLDINYAHSLLSEHSDTDTVTVSSFYTFGPEDESAPEQGRHGWAIFNAPIFLTQQFKVYAADYNTGTGAGTYLNQDLYAASVGGVAQQTALFDLKNPSEGTYVDLFKDLPSYPYSTDIASWHGIREWNAGGDDWTMIFGDTSNPPVGTLSLGVATTQEYAHTTTKLDSSGKTNSVEVTAGAQFTLFKGFSAGVQAGVGIEVGFSSETETEVTSLVSSSLRIPYPPADAPDHYFKELVVQPFWLSASSAKAPWIPSSYSGTLPWCLTWNVLSFETVGGNISGISPAPFSASGQIQNMDDDADSYTVQNGALSWYAEDGEIVAIPISADDFNPSQGATVSINGYLFPADGRKGKWKRTGNLWEYRTRDGVKKDPFLLSLDFEGKKWSFSGRSKNLESNVKCADKQIMVHLAVAGKYGFRSWLDHHVNTRWKYRKVGYSRTTHGIHSLRGTHDSATKAGAIVIRGHFPEGGLAGDLSLVLNGKQTDLPLLRQEDFVEKMDNGGILTYLSDGVSAVVDFEKGKWKLALAGDSYDVRFNPSNGVMEAVLLVGGKEVYRERISIEKYSSSLDLNR